MPSFSGIKTRVWALSRKPKKLYYTNGGIGDELMLTAIAAAARIQDRPMDIIATYPDFWRGNSDPASLQTGLDRWHYARRRNWIDSEIVHLSYVNGTLRHIADQMAAHAGVKLPTGWRPNFPVKAVATRNPTLLAVQNSCSGALYAATTKEWPAVRWQELCERLLGDFEIVQLGTLRDPLLPGVRDLRGRTTLLQAAEVIAEASAFVGLESGLMHVAAATSTPSVIIYGGRTRPVETGYPFNLNLTRAPACAGCGLNSDCPNQLVCLDIPVDEVEAAVRSLLTSTPPREANLKSRL